MTKLTTPSRRRFLGLTGAGVGTAVAGCAELTGDDDSPAAEDDPAQTDDGSSDGTDDTRQVGLFVEPDQEALLETQAEIQQQVENGELDQQEAQQELASRQQELLAEAITATETAVEEAGATTDDTIETQGLLLVSGPASGLLDLLEEDSTGGLVSAGTFEEVKTQQSQG